MGTHKCRVQSLDVLELVLLHFFCEFGDRCLLAELVVAVVLDDHVLAGFQIRRLSAA